MKKVLSCLLVAIVATFSAQAQDAPDSVTFGPQSKLLALTKTKAASWTIYEVQENGEYNVVSDGFCQFDEPFTTTTEFLEQIKEKVIYDFFLDDPRKQVVIETHLKSDVGDVMFTSNTSFYLNMSRDLNGEPVYEIPENGLYLYFFFQGVRIEVPGAVAAKAISGEKDWILDVNSDGVWVPGYFSRTNAYKTLEVTFTNGETWLYDWFGQETEGDNFGTSVDFASFDGIYTLPIYNGMVEHSRLNNNEGWSQIIEINNPVEQEIEFDFREYRKAWSQPTHIWFYSLDENGQWSPTVQKYSTGTDWSESHTETYLIPSGTWFIILEWRDDTKLTPEYYGNKG